MFEDMLRALAAREVHPVIDKAGSDAPLRRPRLTSFVAQVFKWEDTIEAYRYLDSGKHFGKVCIEL